MDQPQPTVVASSLSLLAAIEKTREHLVSLLYTPDTMRHFVTEWHGLVRFAAGRSPPVTVLSRSLVEDYLVSRAIPIAGAAERRHSHIRTSMRVLTEFAEFGCCQRRRATATPQPVHPPMASALAAYEAYCVEHARIGKRSMRHRRTTLTAFLRFVHGRGVAVPAAIAPIDISAFVRSRSHFAQTTTALAVSTLRSFFRIGFAIGAVPIDLSEHVPRVRVVAHARIPSVWSGQEVDALVAAVDTASPLGKRDRAILLLACRLGMRAGDIRDLRLDDIRWRTASLAIRQSKTGEPLELPLSDEVASALIAYLRHGRPTTSRREVFLRGHAPFEPLGSNNNLHGIVSRYRRLAGLRLPPQARRGMHSLRHSIATHLLADGVPLETIGAILGHRSLDATRVYTKVDIEALRSVAMDDEVGQ
ncbi:MAG: site-specific integrase [Polyangiales bacterium]